MKRGKDVHDPDDEPGPDLNAERSVLAAMVLDGNAIDLAREQIDARSFRYLAHSRLFDALVALRAKGLPVDLVTVAKELEERGDLEAVGGPPFLARVMEFASTAANVEVHAAMVRAAATRRGLRKLGIWLQERAEDPSVGTADIFRGLEASVDRLDELERPAASGAPRVTRLSDVLPLPVDWLWTARIPLGEMTILDGDPGLGKSTIVLDIAARLSRGLAMPDGAPGPKSSGTAIMSYEDDAARVIRPRLEAAGADLTRIAIVEVPGNAGEWREPIICPADLAKVEKAIAEVGARLLIVDPLMAGLPSDINGHRDQDVRRGLAPLRRLAERTGCAVVVVRHLNKSGGGSPLYRGGGSIGIIAAARSALLLAADPDDTTGEYRVLAMAKNNLAPPAPALRLRIVADDGAIASRVLWEGSSPHCAASLLAPPASAEDRGALEEAVGFLRITLEVGELPSRKVIQEARRAGISEMTLRRAKAHLHVEAVKIGQPRGTGQCWVWKLPPKAIKPEAREPLRGTEVGKPLCEAIAPEGAQQPESEHLPMNTFDSGHTAPGIEVRDGDCPGCGGRVLDWGGRRICTRCHRQSPPTGSPSPGARDTDDQADTKAAGL